VTARGTLRLTDPRRFGAVVWSPAIDAGAAAKLLAGLGVEPFDPAFTGDHLYQALRRRRVAVKTALLGGDIVVGAGTFTPAKHCSKPASIRAPVRTDSAGRAAKRSPRPCG
jgi:formamidopyrimidine-DNA glycosylase